MKLTKKTSRTKPGELGQWTIHHVVVADPKSEYFRLFADYIADLGKEPPEWYAEQVNEKNEAGVFYPKLDLTLLPMSRYGDRDDFGNAQIMAKHVEDVFKANEEYCAKDEICFDLHGEKNFDTVTFEKELERAMASQEQWNQFKHTKKVSLVRKGDSNE